MDNLPKELEVLVTTSLGELYGAQTQREADQLILNKWIEQVADLTKELADAEKVVAEDILWLKHFRERAEKAEATSKELEKYDIRKLIPEGQCCGNCAFLFASEGRYNCWYLAYEEKPSVLKVDRHDDSMVLKHPNCPYIEPKGDKHDT